MANSGSDVNFQAVERVNPAGAGGVVILCEHASCHIPPEYDGLGLAQGDLTSHAAWDPGARGVAVALSAALDAPLVAGAVSRLVYDCNRPPDAATAMPEQSERVTVPGNRGLPQHARDARTDAVYRPFCAAVSDVIAAQSTPPVLITIHSFAPVFHGAPRAVEIGILHDDDSRLADAMLAQVHRLPHRRIERNAPYGPDDGVTHSLRLHGAGLLNVMIEIRNDLLPDATTERAMADEILTLLRPALAQLAEKGGQDA